MTIQDRAPTAKQLAIFRAIRAYVRVTGEPCSASYLARKFALHHSTIQAHIYALFRKGYVQTASAPVLPERRRIRT